MRKILVVGAEPGSGSTLGLVVRRMPNACAVFCSCRARGAFREFGVEAIALEDCRNNSEAADCIRSLVERLRPSAVVSTMLGPPETSFDRAAMRMCATLAIPHVAVLDSWMNIRSRFEFEGGRPVHVPTAVAVPDVFVRDEVISLGIAADRVIVTGHPFFDEIKRVVRRSKESMKPVRIGYLLQPLSALMMSGHAVSDGYTESDGVALFLEAVHRLELPAGAVDIVLKEHPRMSSRYVIPANYPHSISVDRETAGWEFVQACDVVVGMSSTLLVYAFAAAIPTIVSQPGLVAAQDPNILSRRGVVRNADTLRMLMEELGNAMRRPEYQLDEVSEKGRMAFGVGGDNCGNIVELIGTLGAETR